ncbi:MAG: aminopeptidase P family protein [Syntrophomonadaceae bacterium]|jgi:Xaa-Pro aminopeptidase|nr:aminopeptidase P family protein [Syntrophomonadaceae bacterium]
MSQQRLDNMRHKMEARGLDAMLISKGENLRYLSGFTAGSDALLLLSHQDQYILTDSRYTEQAKRECPNWSLILEKPPDHKELKQLGKKYQRIAFESQDLSYYEYLQLEQEISSQLIPTLGMVEELRMIKEEKELELLRKTAKIGDQVFKKICSLIRVGISESYIANQLLYYLKEYGCEKESFDIISVAGANAALPHGRPGSNLLQAGDMLTLDYGGFYQGYASDMTRTVAIARADRELRDKYQAVLEAQINGVNMVKAGESCSAIDRAVRKSLKKHELGEFFIHGTGHGLGLEIHESPRVSSQSSEILEKNMLITIEPGIYIPGWGGIRIEDTVIVKDGGCEIITHSDKNLLIIDGGII